MAGFRLAIPVAVLAALASPASAADGPKPIRVAVIDVAANGSEKSDVDAARTLTDVLVYEVSKVPGVTVIADAEIKAVLGVEQRKQMLGCDEDASCMAELAGALGVDKVCSGSLGRIESTQVLTLRLIDVKTAKAERRVLEPLEGGAAKFIGRMGALVAQLFPDRVAAAPVAASAPAPAPAAAAPPPPPRGPSFQFTGRPAGASETPAAPPPPAAAPAPPVASATAAPAQGGDGNWINNPWIWLGAGAAVLVGGIFIGGAGAGGDFAIAVGGLGLLMMAGSVVVCVVPSPGGGDTLPPLASPFAVPLDSPAPPSPAR